MKLLRRSKAGRSDRRGSERQPRTTAESRPRPFSYYASRQPLGRNGDQSERPQGRVVSAQQSEKRLRPRLSLKTVCLWFGAACLFGYLMYLQTTPVVSLTSDQPQEVDAALEVYRTDTEKILSSSALNRFKLTLNTRGTAEALKAKHPEIQYASVTAPVFGSSPKVSLTLMRPVALLQSAGRVYGLDSTGHIVSAESAAGLVRVVDESNVTPVPGERFLPVATVKAVVSIAEQASAAGLEVTSASLPQGSPYEVSVRLQDKPYAVRFNLESDILQQSGAMIATIKHLGTNQPGEYMDVRVQGKVYYK